MNNFYSPNSTFYTKAYSTINTKNNMDMKSNYTNYSSNYYIKLI